MMLLRSAALALLLLAACGDDPQQGAPSDSTAASGVDTARRLSSNLPSGRFELPTERTPAPNLWITLPEGYRVKNTGDATGDLFFVVHTEDPGLTDSTADSPAFMRIYVGPEEQRPFAGVETGEGERVMVAGQPLQWRIADEEPAGRARFLRRDIGSAGLFAQFSEELAKTPLHLHIFVAGVDSARVVALMNAAESISIVP